MTADEIKQMWLNPDKRYVVGGIECKIYLQTDFCFYFMYDEKKVICVSKVDYYLQHRLIKEI